MSDRPHEIVIIKRVPSGHEDEHHGGVWKIAFADFMTAMMAFFLVMWLISASDKTKAVIARYFNPVQLVDSTPQPRGLEDPKKGAVSVMPKTNTQTSDPKTKDSEAAKSEGGKSESGKADPAKSEAAKTDAAKADAAKTDAAKSDAAKAAKEAENTLLRDPYAVLADLAAKEKTASPQPLGKAVYQGKLDGSGAMGIKGGDAYRDPFDPANGIDPANTDDPASEAATPTSPAPGDAIGGVARAAEPPPPEATKTAEPASSKPPSAGKATEAVKPAPQDAAAPPSPLANLRADIQALAKPDGVAPGRAPTIELHQTEEGLLIDMTDGADFAMFGNASARPSPKTVVLMEKIGRLLKSQPGQIVLRGYTDSRPFKSDIYDNWRLSAARADIVHYMLVRGGVDERRFERIEGYADRRPRDATDPASPANRRIQILVRGAKP